METAKSVNANLKVVGTICVQHSTTGSQHNYGYVYRLIPDLEVGMISSPPSFHSVLDNFPSLTR